MLINQSSGNHQENLGHIMGISQAYFSLISGLASIQNTEAYISHISYKFQESHISGVSQANLWQILGTYSA